MPYRAPETMTQAEQAKLLEVSGQPPRPRDHVLFSMALGTGLRLSEVLGLDVRHVTPDGETVRHRVRLDQARTKGKRNGEVFLPDRLIAKLERFLTWKMPRRLHPPPLSPVSSDTQCYALRRHPVLRT